MKKKETSSSPIAMGLADSISTALVPFANDKKMTREDAAKSTRAAVFQIAEAGGKLEALAGQLLYEIRENEYWRLFDRTSPTGEKTPFGSFDEYIENECPFKRRTAYYLIAIYEKFVVELGLTPDVLRSIEWSKAKEILAIVNKSNVSDMLTMISKMTVRQVIEMVQDMRGDGSTKSISAISTGTAVREVPTPEEPGTEEPTHTMKVHLFKAQLENIEAALKVAEFESGSSKIGHLLDVLATDYLASRVGDTDDRLDALCGRLDQHIQRFERVFKVKLEVVAAVEGTK